MASQCIHRTVKMSTTSQCRICSKRPTRRSPVASCSICEAVYHRSCGQITDPIFNAIISDTIEWKCLQCRRTSNRYSNSFAPGVQSNQSFSNSTIEMSTSAPGVANPNIAKLEQTVNNMATELQKIQTNQSSLHTSIGTFNNGLKDLQLITKTLNEHDRRLTTVEQTNQQILAEIAKLNSKIDSMEQQSKSDCLQINNVPSKVNEVKNDLENIVINIGKVLTIPITADDIKSVHRIGRTKHQNASNFANNPRKSTSTTAIDETVQRPNPILLSFKNQELRDNMLQSYRSKRTILHSDIGQISGSHSDNKIYVNERLNSNRHQLFIQAKSFQKQHKFKFLWTKKGNIFLRQTESSKIFRVFSNSDFERIAREASEDGGSR